MTAADDEVQGRLGEFAAWVANLKGDEKGEAQVFCEHLFQAFGWKDHKTAGATLEQRIPMPGTGGKTRTKYADLVWQKRLLLEMKKRGEKLETHYQQAFEYWQYCTPHPRYVMLCNFDEFWVYDFDLQLYEPVDRIRVVDLPSRYLALGFMLPGDKKPLFGNNRVDVTRGAADKVASVFNALVGRGISRTKAQKYILQCVVSLFAEDIGLLPRGMFASLLEECNEDNARSFDLIGGLFRWMGSKDRAAGGRYKDVVYFNGGLFAKVEPIELTSDEVTFLAGAAAENWSKVHPAIFGTLFQSSMDQARRHAMGAHFTSEADIQKIVLPTIIRPWRERIKAAKSLDDLLEIRTELEQFQVLDPACGSGNFLYIAYRELVRVEMALVSRLWTEFPSTKAGKRKGKHVSAAAFVSLRQFHGIDKDPFAVELAKVTLLLGRKLAYDEVTSSLNVTQLGLSLERPLPLDNLDSNIVCADALFCDWPEADAIIGNPPYQSKNKMQGEFGQEYVKRVRKRYPDVSGKADYCVYWFRRAHDEIGEGKRVGLVGTNTIRENQSREGGLGYVVQNGGTITEAVSSQVWSGDAQVHVSIVNWIKGKHRGPKLLSWQEGDRRDSPWKTTDVKTINPALSRSFDVTSASVLMVNAESGACYQGQTDGQPGFRLSPEEAAEMRRDARIKKVVHPYLIGDDLLGNPGGVPSQWVIDLNNCEDVNDAERYGAAYKRVRRDVLPMVSANAGEEQEKTGSSKGPRQNHLKTWWKFWRGRPELMRKLQNISRYIACARVTLRPVFEFVDPSIHPNDALQVFTLDDDYSFGILQSGIHWLWFTKRCSTLTARFRYTSDTVFDTFPWPQQCTLAQAKAVAAAAVALRSVRRRLAEQGSVTLREQYRTLETEGKNRLRDAHINLDKAVRSAYGMSAKDDPLEFLLKLNLDLSELTEDDTVIGPGLPPSVTDRKPFITTDCICLP